MAKALTGEGLHTPILIFGSSVSGVHKVYDNPEWFQSCLFCNRGRAAITWGSSHLPLVLFLQVYILLKTCFCESLVLPRRVISLYYCHERCLCAAASTVSCPLMQAQHIWTDVTPLLLKGIPVNQAARRTMGATPFWLAWFSSFFCFPWIF